MMDTTAALKTAVWTILTQDAEMQKICGGEVRVYNVWAPPDSSMPYFAYRLRTEGQDPWVIDKATMHIDGWDYYQTQGRLLAMRRRLVELLDRRWLELPEVGAVRVRCVFAEDVPTDEEYIWRFTSRWTFRYVRTAEMQAIIERGR